MNVFSWLFGDPQAQQAAFDARHKALMAQLQAARARGDRAAERRIIRLLQQNARAGQRVAQAHLQRVETMQGIGHALSAAAHKARVIVQQVGAPVIIAGLVLAWLAWRR